MRRTASGRRHTEREQGGAWLCVMSTLHNMVPAFDKWIVYVVPGI